MKVKDLISKLQEMNQESDVFFKLDDKLVLLEDVIAGQFFRSVNILGKFEYDVLRAEQTLLSCLAYQRDQLNGLVRARIERAIGVSRVEMIISEFDKDKKQKEEDSLKVGSIIEELNQQDIYVESKPEKKVKKSAQKKNKKVNESTDSENSLEIEAEKLLSQYYSGDKSISVESVREAKKLLGEDKSRAIFNRVRNG